MLHVIKSIDEPLIGVKELANRYSLGPETIQDWLRRGFLPGLKVNERWAVSWDEIFFFEGRLAPPAGAAREAAKQPLFTVEFVAKRYDRSRSTVREWFRDGTVAARKIVSAWYTDAVALRDYETQRNR